MQSTYANNESCSILWQTLSIIIPWPYSILFHMRVDIILFHMRVDFNYAITFIRNAQFFEAQKFRSYVKKQRCVRRLILKNRPTVVSQRRRRRCREVFRRRQKKVPDRKRPSWKRCLQQVYMSNRTNNNSVCVTVIKIIKIFTFLN